MRTLLLVAGIVVAAAGRADASSFASGTEAFETGPLPAPYDHAKELAGYRAGYVCEVTGLFWSYVSIRECVPAAINGAEHRSDPVMGKAIAAAYPDVAIPAWARYGWLAILGGVVALAVGGVTWRLRRAARRRKTMVMTAIPYGGDHEPAFVVGPVPTADFVEPATKPYPPMRPRLVSAAEMIEGSTKPYPPMRAARRQAAVMPLADDGPTAADPAAQMKAEEHHRRLARGSYTPQHYEEEATHRVPATPAAIRANALQPPRGMVVRSRK